MLKIRLQRIGKKKQAYFRLVVLPHTTKPQGQYLELLGTYDPHLKKLQVKAERVEHWRKHGAQLSPTANNLLINHKIIVGEKMQSWRPKPNSKKKQAAADKALAKASAKAAVP